jgi:hypothetical protein
MPTTRAGIRLLAQRRMLRILESLRKFKSARSDHLSGSFPNGDEPFF